MLRRFVPFAVFFFSLLAVGTEIGNWPQWVPATLSLLTALCAAYALMTDTRQSSPVKPGENWPPI
jgi:hypothetical protein